MCKWSAKQNKLFATLTLSSTNLLARTKNFLPGLLLLQGPLSKLVSASLSHAKNGGFYTRSPCQPGKLQVFQLSGLIFELLLAPVRAAQARTHAFPALLSNQQPRKPWFTLSLKCACMRATLCLRRNDIRCTCADIKRVILLQLHSSVRRLVSVAQRGAGGCEGGGGVHRIGGNTECLQFIYTNTFNVESVYLRH